MQMKVDKATLGIRAAWTLLLLLSPAPGLFAQELPARPTEYVVDLAGVIDRANVQRLDEFLKELEQKTTAQMLVLTVKTTGGDDIESYAVRVFERWKLGQKGKDNGVLLVVAVQDRRAKIEVGYGLEGTLPDAFCGRIGREVFAPHFKTGDYGRGIYEGTLVLANKVAQEAGVTISGMPSRTLPAGAGRGRSTRAVAGTDGGACASTALVLLVLLVVLVTLFGRGYHIYRHRRYTRGLWFWLLLGGMSNRDYGNRNWGGGWGGGFGGGGFGGFGGGGGGFGGFGGGGGGRSGGGGASFGW